MIIDNILSLIEESKLSNIGAGLKHFASNSLEQSFSKYHGLSLIEKLHQFWEIIKSPIKSANLDREKKLTSLIDNIKDDLNSNKYQSYHDKSILSKYQPISNKIDPSGQHFNNATDYVFDKSTNAAARAEMIAAIKLKDAVHQMETGFSKFTAHSSFLDFDKMLQYLKSKPTDEIVKEIVSKKGDLKEFNTPIMHVANHLDSVAAGAINTAAMYGTDAYLLNKGREWYNNKDNMGKLPYSGSTQNNFNIPDEVSKPLLQQPEQILHPIAEPELKINIQDDNDLETAGSLALAGLGTYGAYKYIKNHKK